MFEIELVAGTQLYIIILCIVMLQLAVMEERKQIVLEPNMSFASILLSLRFVFNYESEFVDLDYIEDTYAELRILDSEEMLCGEAFAMGIEALTHCSDEVVSHSEAM